jgi:hypothetical protein
MCKRNIELFLKQPNYYKIEGRPVFMIYEVTNFIKGMGGVKEASEALQWFRQEVKKAGFPDLELQFTMYSTQFNLSGVDKEKVQRPEEAFMKQLGFNSLSHYQFAHYVWPDGDYDVLLERTKTEWTKIDSLFTMPYYPHISIGWDNSPRIGKSPQVKNNTPENFAKGLRMARDYVDRHPDRARDRHRHAYDGVPSDLQPGGLSGHDIHAPVPYLPQCHDQRGDCLGRLPDAGTCNLLSVCDPHGSQHCPLQYGGIFRLCSDRQSQRTGVNAPREQACAHRLLAFYVYT